MASLWDMISGNEAAMQQINPTYGVPQQFVRDSAINALGQIGGLLMAAGQPVDPAVRAQMLGQIGAVGSGMNTDIYKAAQARLMASQLQTAQQEQQRIQNIGQRIKDPEFLKSLGITREQAEILGPKGLADVLERRAAQDPLERQLTQLKYATALGAVNTKEQASKTVQQMLPNIPEPERGYAVANPVEYLQKVSEQSVSARMRPPSDLDRKIQALTAGGEVPPAIAAGIAAGRFAAVADPVSGQPKIIDKATGRIVDVAAAATAPAAAAPAAAAPATAAPTPSAIPPNVDYSQATGIGAPVRRVINTLTGLTMGETQYPETSAATNALEDLRRRTITSFSTEVPGRPTNYTQQLMESATVDPYALFQSDPAAISRLGQTRRSIQAEIDRIETDITGKDGQAPKMSVKPEELSRTRANLSQLKRLKEEYDQVIANFGPKQKPAAAAPKQQPQMEMPSRADMEAEARRRGILK
jgi:hypothetical protein